MDLNLNANYPINEYIELQTLYEPSVFGASITASSFDSQQELFWTGHSDGRVSSHYSVSLSKYTSFRVQQDQYAEIRMIYPHTHHNHRNENNSIFVLTSDTFSCYNRFGTNIFKHKEISFQNLQCMFFNQQERFFLSGFSDLVYDFDIERLRVLRQLNINDEQKDCILIKSTSASSINMSSTTRNGMLVTGSTSGQVLLRDPCTFKSLHKFQPHSGSLSDFDVHGNQLVTCGFASTRTGQLCVDRFLMIYDLRMMRALTPVQLLIEPCFLHYLPVCSSIVAVASQSGCFQLTDTNLLTPSPFYQAQCAPIGLATTFSVSENCQAIAFGHSSGSVHLFSKGENILFNDFSEPTLFIDAPQYSNTFIDINNEIAPLSSVPVPLTDENSQKLISDWPKKVIKPNYRPTPVINSELLSNSRIIHGIISVPNRTEMKRNQVFNKTYQDGLEELNNKSFETAICLELMIQKQLETTELITTNNNNNNNELNELNKTELVEVKSTE